MMWTVTGIFLLVSEVSNRWDYQSSPSDQKHNCSLRSALIPELFEVLTETDSQEEEYLYQPPAHGYFSLSYTRHPGRFTLVPGKVELGRGSLKSDIEELRECQEGSYPIQLPSYIASRTAS